MSEIKTGAQPPSTPPNGPINSAGKTNLSGEAANTAEKVSAASNGVITAPKRSRRGDAVFTTSVSRIDVNIRAQLAGGGSRRGDLGITIRTINSIKISSEDVEKATPHERETGSILDDIEQHKAGSGTNELIVETNTDPEADKAEPAPEFNLEEALAKIDIEQTIAANVGVFKDSKDSLEVKKKAGEAQTAEVTTSASSDEDDKKEISSELSHGTKVTVLAHLRHGPAAIGAVKSKQTEASSSRTSSSSQKIAEQNQRTLQGAAEGGAREALKRAEKLDEERKAEERKEIEEKDLS